MKKSEMSFEESLKRLDEIVRSMENPDIHLQEGFSLYEQGMKLTREMKKELNDIEKKVKILQKNAQGELEERDFSGEENDDISS